MGVERLVGLLLGVSVLAAPLAAQDADDDSDENAVVGQSLSWQGDDDALRYELVITDAAGHELVHQNLEVPQADLLLKPGTYRYQVRVYNVLDQLDSASPWQELVILRAETPGPKTMTPSTMYLEDPVLKFKVEGILLITGAKYRIYRRDNPQLSAEAKVVSQLSDQEVELTFPNFEFAYGDYNLTIENPGGLKHTLRNALAVRFSKPFDLHLSVGYAPKFLLWDAWYQSVWDQIFYPLGADARLTFLFLKENGYQIGAELETTAWMQSGGIPSARIQSKYLSGGLNFVYMWLLNKQWRLTERVGGGYMAGSHTFDYDGVPGPQFTSVDPYAEVSSSLFWAITRYWHVQAGVELINGFGNGYLMGFLQPTLETGVSY